MIDWTQTKRHERFIKGRSYVETRYLCICDLCQGERYLKKVDAQKDEICYRCTQRWKGKRGWLASNKTLRQRRQRALGLQAYRREHPSDLEIAVKLTLDDLGVVYEIEPILQSKAGNFYHFDFRVGLHYIEVDGEFVHSLPNKSRARRNKKALCKRRDLPFRAITEADIRAGRTEQILIEFLQLEVTPREIYTV
jgi:hypothetical protein